MSFDSNWKVLKQAIDAIHTKQESPVGYMELLQVAWNIIKGKGEEQLYKEARKVTSDHMNAIISNLLYNTQEEDLLVKICDYWEFL